MNKQERKLERRMVQDVAAAFIGIVLLFASQYIPNAEAGLIIFLVATAVGAFGIADLSHAVHVMNKQAKQSKELLPDQKGVAWILAVAALSICFMPVIYWIVGAPYDFLVTYITGIYTFTGTTASALVVVRLIISYLLAFFLVGVVAWSIINAKAEAYG